MKRVAVVVRADSVRRDYGKVRLKVDARRLERDGKQDEN